MLYRFFGILVLGFVVAACATPNTDNYLENVVLVLDWTPNTNHTGFFVAIDRGYFEAEGLAVEVIQPFEDGSITLVAAGHAQFGISFQEEVVVAANASVPLPVVAIAALVQDNTSGVLSLAEHGITSFAELEGRTFGSWMIPIYDEIIREAIRMDGGNPDLVEFVPNMALDTITAITLEFDATWVFEGWDRVIADMQGIATNFLALRDISPIFNYYTPVLITHTGSVHDPTTQAFLRASRRGFEFAQNNPTEAAHILHNHAPEMDIDILLASQQFLSQVYFHDTWGYINEERWMGFFNWMQENGFIAEDAENSGFYMTDF
ncbi:MAG: ABC transporter substrate-binding protein [Defluviitaleaceae bacterium]|nr:ABC transporter substrate-binding protein [Defluviitaleaceae bacterium]